MASNKYIIWGCIAYLLYSMIPTSRVFIEWQNTDHPDAFAKMFSMFFYLNLVMLVPLFAGMFNDKLAAVMNKIANYKAVVVVCSGAILLSFVMAVARQPGLWWTWPSFGLQVITVLLTYIILYGKVPNFAAALAGVFVSGVAIGLWEIPYQIGMSAVYYSQYCDTYGVMRIITSEILIELPLITCGVAGLMWINKKYKVIAIGRTFWLLFGLAAFVYSLWFITGFQVEMIYNWDTYEWVQNTGLPAYNRLIWRASKVLLALALISMFKEKVWTKLKGI